jgi:hypothetical protein
VILRIPNDINILEIIYKGIDIICCIYLRVLIGMFVTTLVLSFMTLFATILGTITSLCEFTLKERTHHFCYWVYAPTNCQAFKLTIYSSRLVSSWYTKVIDFSFLAN